MRLQRATGWAAAAFLAFGVTACNRSEPVATERDTSVPPAQEDRAGNIGANDDSRITTSVMARYQADNQLRGSDIDVTSNQGVVTLRGTVDSEQVKNQALTIARQIEGVTEVNDQLQVEAAQATTGTANRPESQRAERSDMEGTPGWITTKIQAQYFVNPEIKPWNIDVTTTSGGVVTLSGEVEDAAAREEALRIARATEGVTRVEDSLRVRGETAATTGTGENRENTAERSESARPSDGEDRVAMEQPDAWLTSKVQAKYFMDGDVKGRDINVDTQNGVVTLKGTVESEAERRQAVALARNTDGVREVRDQLQVQPTSSGNTAANRNEGRGQQAGTAVNDTWITTKIQSKYFLDADVKGNDINVESRNGVVTLKGTVENDAQKQAATQIARETDGVTRVVDQLTVGSASGNAQQGQRQ